MIDLRIVSLSKLVGGTIDGTAISTDREFFGLAITKTDGQKVVIWFLSDDEGNGPGSFDIQHIPTEKGK